MSPPLDGIDVSDFQWPVVALNLPRLKREGLQGCWCKCSDGANYSPPHYNDWRAAQTASGLPYTGVYHWIQPDAAAQLQVGNIQRRVGQLKSGESIQLDWEVTPGKPLPAMQLVVDIYRMLVVIYGQRVMVYGGWSYLKNLPADIPTWLAWYTGSRIKSFNDIVNVTGMAPSRRPVIWQWGGGAEGVQVGGKGVDSNQFLDVARLRMLSGYVIPPTPVTPAPIPPPVILPPATPSPGPVIPTPAPRQGDDDMALAPYLFHCNTGQVGIKLDGSTFTCPGEGTVFMADGDRVFYRWVTAATLGDDAFASGQRGGNANPPGDHVEDLEAMGVLVGRVPHL